MEEKQTQINFEKDRCYITNIGVHSGINIQLKDVETYDLKFLIYKITQELIKRGEL